MGEIGPVDSIKSITEVEVKKQVVINMAKWEAANAYAKQNRMRFRVVSEDQLFHQGTRK
jgi:hypothetical protein